MQHRRGRPAELTRRQARPWIRWLPRPRECCHSPGVAAARAGRPVCGAAVQPVGGGGWWWWIPHAATAWFSRQGPGAAGPRGQSRRSAATTCDKLALAEFWVLTSLQRRHRNVMRFGAARRARRGQEPQQELPARPAPGGDGAQRRAAPGLSEELCSL